MEDASRIHSNMGLEAMLQVLPVLLHCRTSQKLLRLQLRGCKEACRGRCDITMSALLEQQLNTGWAACHKPEPPPLQLLDPNWLAWQLPSMRVSHTLCRNRSCSCLPTGWVQPTWQLQGHRCMLKADEAVKLKVDF